MLTSYYRTITSRRFDAFLLIVAIVGMLLLSACVPQQGGRTATQVKPNASPGEPVTYYSGYSEQFLPYREKLQSGKAEEVKKVMLEEENKIKEKSESDTQLASKLRLVGLMERSSLALQTGDADQSIRYCRLAQELIEERESESYAKEYIAGFGSLLADFAGAGEYGRYDAPGYEKVLLLNLASIAYLLNGDDRAFNVARLAIQWQQEEKEKFEEVIAKGKEDKEKVKEGRESDDSIVDVTSALDREFSKYDKVALQVPNAFVNPFGDYVTGMVYEFKSVKLKSLLSNAHIAYKDALELNPKSKVLKRAVNDTKNKKLASRLIHVVALDGFVPEKKVLSIPLAYEIDVEIPTYEPIPSRVAKIHVTNLNGDLFSVLHPIADIDALALRYQKDRLPGMYAMVIASVIRDVGIVKLGDNISDGLGGLVRNLVDTFQEPDTTSWMSLPSRILGARFYAPKGLKKFKVSSFDKSGKKLSEKVVKLNAGNNHFVLVRSLDKSMFAYASKKIWSPKRRAQHLSSRTEQ